MTWGAEPVASAAYRNGWPDFPGNVRDHVDSIQELVASHPELGYWSIGRRLEQKLCVRLPTANLKVTDRIMQELSEGRAAVGSPQLEEFYRNVREHAADFSGNVRDHVDSIQELAASHPELGYKAIGRRLEQKLCVRLSTANLRVIDRIMQELSEGRAAVGGPQLEEFYGNVRDHADSIRALVAAHPGMGYRGISKEFQKHIRLRLSPAHMQTVKRIVDGISQARAAPSTQRDTDNYEVASADVRHHSATIMELMTRHPTMDYHGIAVELEKVLGVELSQSQKEGISSVMAEISIDLVTDDEAMSEESEVGDIFSGSVRDHVDSIRELMASHPDDGYKSIGSMLGQRLGVKLSTAHLQVVYRIMKELSEGRAVEPDWGEFSGDVRHHVDYIRALVALHPGLGYKGIAHEFGQHIRQNLSQAHVSVIQRIVDGISRGRAVSQRARSDCAEGAVDVRDHVETIEELMMQDPSLDYQGIARQLEDKLQVQLSDGQKKAICGLMAQIGIHLLADDKALDIEAFNGDVREHVDAIRDLVASHPDSGYRVIGSMLGEQLGVRLQYAHLQMVYRVMTELAEGRAAVGVAIRQQPERQNYPVFTGNLREHSCAIRELLTQHPTAGRVFISRELGLLIGRRPLCSNLSMHMPTSRRSAKLCSITMSVVLPRRCSDVGSLNTMRLMLKGVLFEDKYVDCAAICWSRRVRAKTDEDLSLQAKIKVVYREAVPYCMLREARHRAATIRRWDAERRREFSAACYGACPCRTVLPSGSRGAEVLQGYRFFVGYENWVCCQQCGYRWQVHNGQVSGQRLVYGETLRADAVQRLPLVRTCCDRGYGTACSLPLEAFLWPLPAEIEAGVKTEQLYLVPQKKHWPVYLPGLQRFVTAYDFGPRLAAMREAMLQGPVDTRDLDELVALVEEHAVYAELVRQHGTEGIVSLLDITKDEAATITPYLLFVTKQKERGSVTKGPTYNWKKTQVCRVNYNSEDLETCGAMTPRARAAYDWLMAHNRTYRRYVIRHKHELAAPVEDREMYIATYRLLIQCRGIEVALCPVLYPWEVFSDSDVSSWAKDHELVKPSQQPTIKSNFLRKVRSRCRTHGDAEAVPDLAFLLYDMATAQRISASLAIAERQGITPDVVADNSSTSESYWRHEQDILCDVVRQHALLRGVVKAPPNLFITIAPAEWKVFLHEPLFADWKAADRLSACQGLLAEHIYELLYDGMKQILRPNEFLEEVFDYVIRLEFQGRKTEHIHIAAWVLPKGRLSGRSGQADRSAFVMFLEEVFRGSVDVQEGYGFLNYINGYVVKANQSMDFQPDAARSAGDEHSAWRTTYRMLCKLVPGLPEVYLDFVGAKRMFRTFGVVSAYAIIPAADDKHINDTKRLYKLYLKRACVGNEPRPCGSFLSYLRVYNLRMGTTTGSSNAEDNFIGQFCTMMFPHGPPGTFVPPLDSDPELIPFTKHYLKAVKYLRHLECLKGTRPACEQAIRLQVQAMLLREANRIAELCDASVESIGDRLHEYSWEPFDSWPWLPPPDSDSEDAFIRPAVQLFHPLRCADDTQGAYGKPFHCVDAALHYLEDVIGADLRIRVSLGRHWSFRARLHAVHVYYNHMHFCFDNPEAIPPDARRRADCLLPDMQNRYYEQYERERRRCQAHARPRITWSADQQEVLKVVDGVLSRADANIVQQQFYYVNGKPGSGKTEVLCEAARRAADAGLHVLILGPTGTLVHTYKTKVQHDNINVETIYSAWHIYRRADTVVDYAPPSRLRTYDLIIIDEASQIEDDVAVRLHNGFRELPQRPTIFFAADFQQLNPLGSSSAMRTWITVMTTISLFTIHRTNDDRLLSFLRNVRVKQPSKAVIRAFFAGRTWDSISSEQAVRRGMHLGAIRDEPFHWLTVTNKGAEAVNLACLSACGYDKPENLSPLCGDLK
ncbi:unnamed protein product, partial [Prorocentrum cordatum]